MQSWIRWMSCQHIAAYPSFYFTNLLWLLINIRVQTTKAFAMSEYGKSRMQPDTFYPRHEKFNRISDLLSFKALLPKSCLIHMVMFTLCDEVANSKLQAPASLCACANGALWDHQSDIPDALNWQLLRPLDIRIGYRLKDNYL